MEKHANILNPEGEDMTYIDGESTFNGGTVGCHKTFLMSVYVSFPFVFMFCKTNVCYIY